MIRLTLLLIAGIAVTMYVFGDTADMPQGSDAGGPDLATRGDRSGPSLLSQVSSLIDADTPETNEGERVPLADERSAIEIALAATVTPDAPVEAGPRTVQLTAVSDSAPAQETTASAAATQAPWIVTGSRVNLRAGPSTSEAVVGQVVEGQRAEVLEETADGWYRIQTAEDGKSGFIYGRFLSRANAG